MDEPSPDMNTNPASPEMTDADLLHFLLDNIPDRIYFKDRESRFIRVSRAMAELFGLESAHEAIGKSDADFFTPEHAQPALADEQQVIRTGESIVGKVEKETLPGEKDRWAITTKMPLLNPSGEIIGTCGVSKEFTEQKVLQDALAASNEALLSRQQQLEQALADLNEAHQNLKLMQQRLLEAEKMESLGRVAYGVAHEIRNPLSVLQAGIQFFGNSEPLQKEPANVEVLGEMKSAIKRADAVVSGLMDTATDDLKLELHDFRDLIDNALAVIEPVCRSRNISILKELASDLPSIKMDQFKMEEVFSGLFTNAIDAMSEGGTLIVRARLKELTDPDVERNPGLRSFKHIRSGDSVALIEVEDTGTGIPKDALSKIFDPFFTTRATGSGTGLGLTICRKIIELHKGIIQVDNREEGGVRVSIFLQLRT